MAYKDDNGAVLGEDGAEGNTIAIFSEDGKRSSVAELCKGGNNPL